jgi:hypothetical protein
MIWNVMHRTDDEELARLDHPYTLPRPPMPREMRAAQFAPFAALSGYEEKIRTAARRWEEEYESRCGLVREAAEGDGYEICDIMK